MIAQRIQFKSKQGTPIAEVLDEVGHNWHADEQELITGAGVFVPKFKALVRSDTNHVLGVVGAKYEPTQLSTAFAFLDSVVTAHEATYDNMHLIDQGSRVIVQAKIGNGDGSFDIRKGDSIQSYITMINSFDGSTPFKVFFTPIRLFCKNQLNAALKNATTSVSIRHTKNSADKAEQAQRTLGLAHEYFAEFKKTAKMLAQKSIDAKMIDMFLAQCMGEPDSTRKSNQHEEVKQLIENGKGNNGSSVWDMYNGVTEYVDHYSSKDSDKRMASAMVGTGFNLKSRAWDAAMALI